MHPEEIDRTEVLSYLRAPALDGALLQVLDECIAELCAAIVPRTVFRVLPVQHTEHSVLLGGFPLEGKDIALHLTGCEQAVLMAGTLSAAADACIRRASVSDMTRALMLDAVAGAAIERVMNGLEAQLKEQYVFPYYTARFSPGYGDFPITQQRGLVQLLDAPRRIGLTVTQHSTLLPMKSVTAVMGLSHRPVRDARRFCCGSSCGECPYREGCGSAQGVQKDAPQP